MSPAIETAVTQETGRALLLHNTAEPLGELRVTEQREAMKPLGLWYGVGDAWLEWCHNEMPMWELRLGLRQRVYLESPRDREGGSASLGEPVGRLPSLARR